MKHYVLTMFFAQQSVAQNTLVRTRSKPSLNCRLCILFRSPIDARMAAKGPL